MCHVWYCITSNFERKKKHQILTTIYTIKQSISNGSIRWLTVRFLIAFILSIELQLHCLTVRNVRNVITIKKKSDWPIHYFRDDQLQIYRVNANFHTSTSASLVRSLLTSYSMYDYRNDRLYSRNWVLCFKRF